MTIEIDPAVADSSVEAGRPAPADLGSESGRGRRKDHPADDTLATTADDDQELPLAAETLFHSEPWRQSVEQSFEVKFLSHSPASEPTGSAWYSVLSDVRGERVVSTPFSDFCDPMIQTERGWDDVASHLRSFDRPVTIRPFRNRFALADTSFEHRRDLLWHGVDLTDGPDRIWDGLKSKLRTTIRRAPKTGLRFRFSNSIDDVATFHAMHVDLRKTKYRLLAQPFGFFEALHERFGDDMAVLLAEEEDGTAVASMIFFAWNGVWYYKFSASYPRRYRPNAAMIMEACREGAERGLGLLDMGRSDLDQPGLIDFKRQFATDELELATLHWSPDDHDRPTTTETGRLFGEVTHLLTDPAVSDEVTARAGDLLYRYFG